MPNLIGPSHHLYFTALQRRYLWLRHLSAAFLSDREPGFNSDEFERLERKYTGILACLENATLGQVLDDTPVVSYLSRVASTLDTAEQDFFAAIASSNRQAGWFETLEQTSLLWGRELAQEMRTNLHHLNASSRSLPSAASVRGIFEMLSHVLHGGDFTWKPLLLRRSTDDELIYELRACPHRKGAKDSKGADYGCRLEANVYRGFIQAWVAGASFERKVGKSFCMDEVRTD